MEPEGSLPYSQTSPPLVLVWSQMNPVRTFLPFSSNTYLILSSNFCLGLHFRLSG